jgi:SpoVK/Ycf46/Vps4 family AAA+-type ATPase
VLLLDEADTYMEERTAQDIQRNGLVSVFLRKLEYCEAIMFLTTNRVTAFDSAILSRMHVMIAFPDIDLDCRKQIWSRFTTQGPAKVTAKDLSRLLEPQLYEAARSVLRERGGTGIGVDSFKTYIGRLTVWIRYKNTTTTIPNPHRKPAYIGLKLSTPIPVPPLSLKTNLAALYISLV